MLPIIPKPAISPRQKALALGVAGFVDLLQVVIFPAFGEGFFSPLQDALDFLTAILLVAICGFKWQFVAGFMLELIPGVSLFPTWTAVALMLPTRSNERDFAAHERFNVTPVQPSPTYPRVDVQARVVPPIQPPPVQTGH